MNFYIPIEVKNREILAKLYLAKHAAEAGFNVVLGRKNGLNELVLRMPRGIYLGLGAFENFRPFYRDLAQRGFKIIVNEEEGLVTYSDEMYVNMRVSGATLEHVAELCTWGEENQKVLSSTFPQYRDKFHVTGNPRFDLLKKQNHRIYRKDIDEIKSKYKRFVLICASFSSVNHYDKDLNYVQSLVEKKTLRDEDSIRKFESYRDLKATTLSSFLEAIPLLAKAAPDVAFVVRPHPSENPGVYQALEAKFANIHVDSRFSVHPWIIAAEAIVHHYCTTSIEALAVGTPRFSLRPLKDTASEKEFPFECSVECPEPAILAEKLSQCLNSGAGACRALQNNPDYSCYALNIGPRIAAAEIVERAVHLRNDVKQESALFMTSKTMTARLGYGAKNFLRAVKRKGQTHEYLSHKFARFSQIEVEETLRYFGAVNLESRQFSSDIVSIRQA